MAQTTFQTIGVIERYDSALNQILAPDAKAEIIAEGFGWSEGPLWIENQEMLLFFRRPAKHHLQMDRTKRKKSLPVAIGLYRYGEMGSNGLLLDNKGRLVICQHGDRQMARMQAPFNNQQPDFVKLAGEHRGNRLNRPNDACYNSQGVLFFTDPPYGLPQRNESDPTKETPWNGVYKVEKNGEVVSLIDSLTRPNGIAFFPVKKSCLLPTATLESQIGTCMR